MNGSETSPRGSAGQRKLPASNAPPQYLAMYIPIKPKKVFFFLKNGGSLNPQKGSQLQLLGSCIFFSDRLYLPVVSGGSAPLKDSFLVHAGGINGSGSF